jgi:hypothetical protein
MSGFDKSDRESLKLQGLREQNEHSQLAKGLRQAREEKKYGG